MSLFKKYFLTGLIVWIPISATYLIVSFIFHFVNDVLNTLPTQYHPSTLIGFEIPGLNLILLIIVLWLTGLLSANYLAKKIGHLGEYLLSHIPFVRNIYTTIKQSIAFILSPKNKSFNKVLRIEYPRKGIYSIGFLTNDKIPDNILKNNEKRKYLMVFVPTTPNPTSGFMVMVPEDECTELNLSIDAALKLVISLGTIIPKK
jgi:uncharacterized membrane protein